MTTVDEIENGLTRRKLLARALVAAAALPFAVSGRALGAVSQSGVASMVHLDTVGALLVIEPQKFILNEPYIAIRETVHRIARLASAFHERRFPVFLLKISADSPGRGRTDAAIPAHITTSGWTDLVPELAHQISDIIVEKPRWGGFVGTTLDYDLRQRNVKQVFVTGIATSIGVESTAREAYDFGYDVVPIVDAMTDRTTQAQQNSVTKIFPRLGVPTTTAAVLAALKRSG